MRPYLSDPNPDVPETILEGNERAPQPESSNRLPREMKEVALWVGSAVLRESVVSFLT